MSKENKRDDKKVESPVGGQFEGLGKWFQSYIKVTALGAIREISDSEIARNTWLLNEAGYSQPEIAKILATSQPTISRILAGKPAKRKGQREVTK